MSEMEPSGSTHDPTLPGDRTPPLPPRGDDAGADRTRPGSRLAPPSGRHSTRVRALETSGFERYQLGAELGRGGLGMVRVARDVSLQREVAIKSILRSDSQRAVLSFVEEAQITGQLEHPNIVPVHEIGLDSSGHPYLAMKRVQGRTLRDVIAEAHEQRRQNPAAWPAAEQRLIDVFLKVCDAIAYAHSRGVIHRDLKPENVMVGAFGEVLVMDWGLARPLERLRAADEADETDDVDPTAETRKLPDSGSLPVISDRRQDTPDVTRDGAIVGTPAYMAPEQAAGRVRDLDQRTDVYALGAMLYAIATAQPPYSLSDRQHVVQVLADVTAGSFTPPRAATGGRVSRELDAIIRKAMARLPERRYASVPELQADLAAWRAHEATTARRAGWPERALRWTRRHPKTTLTAGLVLVAGLVVTVLLSQLQLANEIAERRARDLKTENLLRELAEGRASSVYSRAQHLLDQQTRASIDDFYRRSAAALAAGTTLREFTSSLTAEQGAEYLRAFDQKIGIHADFGTAPALEDWKARAMLRHYTGDIAGALADIEQAMRIRRDDPQVFTIRGNIHRSQQQYEAAIRDFNEALRLQPRDQGALLNRGVVWHEMGEFDAAIRDYRELLAINPAQFQALLNCATVRFDAGDFTGAIADYDAAQLIVPDNLMVWFGRAGARAAIGDLDGAIRDYNEALRLDPTSAKSFNNRGTARHASGDLAGAIADFTEAVRLNPQLSEGFTNRGVAHLELGRLAEAARDLEEALRLEPGSPNARYGYGRVLHAQGDDGAAIRAYDEALRLLAQGTDTTDTAQRHRALVHEAYLHRGIARQASGDLDGALADYDEALQRGPRSAAALVSRAALRHELGNLEGAMADCDKALQLDSRSGRAFYNRGNVRYARGDLDGAIADFDEALRLEPRDAQALTNRGMARLDLGDAAGAFADHNAALEIDPRYAVAMTNRGVAHQATRNLDAAIRDYDAALAIDPQLADAWVNRGSAHHMTGNVDAAIRDYSEALRLDPRQARALINRGIAWQARQKFDDAIADYEAALAIDPALWQAAANRGSLLAMRGRRAEAARSLAQAYRHCPDADQRQGFANFIRMLGGTVPDLPDPTDGDTSDE